MRPTSLLAAIVLALTCLASFAQEQSESALFVTTAKQAYVVDHETGTVLFAKNEDAPVPPASLAKLMTAELVFNALETGVITPETMFRVSEYAWRTGGAVAGGSTMFAELKSEIAVPDLLRGMIVQSGNDSAIILAEGLAGSEENFVARMNERAADLGLTETRFGNSNGLPHPDNRTTMKDMVRLSRHLLDTYPDWFRLYAEPDFTWNGIRQRNRNPVLRMEIGADGLKTGFTEESGYAIVATARRSGRRVFAALSGLESAEERASEARKILEWALGAFERETLFDKGEVVSRVRVYGGATAMTDVVAEGPITLLLPLANKDKVKAEIVYDGPVKAPVVAGQQIGDLVVMLGDTEAQRVPVFASKDNDVGPIHTRALAALGEALTGWLK